MNSVIPIDIAAIHSARPGAVIWLDHLNVKLKLLLSIYISCTYVRQKEVMPFYATKCKKQNVRSNQLFGFNSSLPLVRINIL